MAHGEPEHFDVLVVGAGLSGIGFACHLRRELAHKTFAILEARDAIGGTWDLFRYPGIRSDSDMFTLGYRFRPWREAEAIADGAAIRSYVRETAAAHGVDRAVRFGHRVVRCAWSSAQARWTVDVERAGGGTARFTCSWLMGCTGYYRYDQGYTPVLEGIERFRGEVVHPQHWPEDLDHSGRRVLVIGSGATAVTLVPALAGEAEHVTMLQRSPSYIVTLPARDPFAVLARRLLPVRVAYPLVRWKNVLLTLGFFGLSRRFPRLVRAAIRRGVLRHAPPGTAVDTHFNPRYDPWDQRVCLVPDGDLFDALRSGRAEIVTDTIETFTEDGVRLASGRELEADLVITATGLNLQVNGGAEIEVDGRRIDPAQTVGYKGMMLSGVPNAAITLGYTNASWTLKADLVAEYVCRLLRHMDDRDLAVATPLEPPPDVGREPFIDLQSGYVLRSIDLVPKQGSRAPWRLHQNYVRDVLLLRRGSLEDEGIAFAPAPAGAAAPERAAA